MTGVLLVTSSAFSKALKAPAGLFVELNDQIAGDAVIIRGKQLFIDDYIIAELKGVKRVLNQPIKHPRNPLITIDKPWEGIRLDKPSILYDPNEGLYKMWYLALGPDKPEDLRGKNWFYNFCYATSGDGIAWKKPLINKKERNNVIRGLKPKPHASPGIFKDPHEANPARRYKMMCSGDSGPPRTRSTNVAYSPDGINWTTEPANPVVPFADSPCYPF